MPPIVEPISSVRFCSGKKLASARRKRMAGNNARKKIRELRRQIEVVVLRRFLVGSARQLRPRERQRGKNLHIQA